MPSTYKVAKIVFIISLLKNLKKVKICLRHFIRETFPRELEKFTSLQTLSDSLFFIFSNLVFLESIILEMIELGYISYLITSCKALKELCLTYNHIDKIPNFLCELENLETFSFIINNIDEIPEKLANLEKLRSLDLSYNEIDEISNYIGSFKSIEKLRLCGNKIKIIPTSISKLKELRIFISMEMRYQKYQIYLII